MHAPHDLRAVAAVRRVQRAEPSDQTEQGNPTAPSPSTRLKLLSGNSVPTIDKQSNLLRDKKTGGIAPSIALDWGVEDRNPSPPAQASKHKLLSLATYLAGHPGEGGR